MLKNHKVRKVLVALLKILLTAVVIYFVVRALADNWSQVVAYKWSINWALLLASVAMHLITFAAFAAVWCLLMRGFGHGSIPFRHGFKIAYIANLGRYIPGRIWPVFGMVYVAKKLEITEETAVASWGVAQLFSVPPSFVVGLAVIYWYPEMVSDHLSKLMGQGLNIFAAATLLISILLIAIPDKLLIVVNWALNKFKRPAIHFKMSFGLALGVYLGYLICWLCYGFAFWLFINAIVDHPGIPILSCVGSFVISYQIGYFAIFAPAGIGARELVMIGTLNPYLGAASAGVSIAARVWNTTSDIIASIIALRVKL